MDKTKNIFLNMAAIIIAAITVCNLQREAPIDPIEWNVYMNSYLKIMMACTGIMYIILLFDNSLTLVKRSVVFCSILLLVSTIKCILEIFDYNAYWDYGVIGVSSIFCFFRITIVYIKKALSLFKLILNQTYMKWPYRLKKKRG